MSDMTHKYGCRYSSTYIYVTETGNWNVWHDSFIYVTWLIHMCDITHEYGCRDSSIRDTDWQLECVTWLIHICDMTDSCVWHYSFICLTWLIQMCDIMRSYVIHTCHLNMRHVLFICMSWLISLRDVTRWYVRHDSFIRDADLRIFFKHSLSVCSTRRYFCVAVCCSVL